MIFENRRHLCFLIFLYSTLSVVYSPKICNSEDEKNYDSGSAFIVYAPETGQWWIQDKNKETTSIVTTNFKSFQFGYAKSADEVGRLWEECIIDKKRSVKEGILCFKGCREFFARNKPLSKKESKLCTKVITTDPMDAFK